MDGEGWVYTKSSYDVGDMSNLFLSARVNSVMFYVLWTCAPILVSITSFTVYVLRGNKLDIPTAFTVSDSLVLNMF